MTKLYVFSLRSYTSADGTLIVVIELGVEPDRKQEFEFIAHMDNAGAIESFNLNEEWDKFTFTHHLPMYVKPVTDAMYNFLRGEQVQFPYELKPQGS